jgi:ABC-type multidrug transport system fused ATPase/permease subunit
LVTNKSFFSLNLLRSYPISAVIVLLFVLAQGCLVSTNLWLKHWIAKSKEDPTGNSMSVSLFLGVYAALTLAYVLLYVVIEWLGLAVARVRAAERIHANLLARIFRLSMAFFDTTPLGRIINRFSSDMASIDIRVTQKIMDILLFGISVCSTLLMVAFTVRSFIFVVPFLVVAYWVVFKCFTCVSRMTMRIYAIARSPIYHHFSESLGGVATIRAFRVQDRFIEANAVLTDRATNICVSNMTCRRWLESNLRILSSVVLLCTALFAVLDSEDVDPSLVGLTLSFALTLTEEMTTVVRSCSDFQVMSKSYSICSLVKEGEMLGILGKVVVMDCH